MSAAHHGAEGPSDTTLGFLHDDPEFAQLLRVLQAETGLGVEFVEKDYWVTHVLWWLQREGFGVSFKGGTSLAKCFGLIQRFSEDIDMHLVVPSAMAAPTVHSWTPPGAESEAEDRLAYFAWLARELARLPGITGVHHDLIRHAPRHINAIYYLEYDSMFHDTGVPLQKSVPLEIAPDRIHALVVRPASSLVHDTLSPEALAGYLRNRPEPLPCAHPLATLLGKLDAICNQYARAADPSRYMRHFEDAHHIIRAIPSLSRGIGEPTAEFPAKPHSC